MTSSRTSTNAPAAASGSAVRIAGLLVVVAVASPPALGRPGRPARRPRPRADDAPCRRAVARPAAPVALGEADGAVPDGTTVFDDERPGVANLDPALLDALRRAATDAAADGVDVPRQQRLALRRRTRSSCSARRSPKYGSRGGGGPLGGHPRDVARTCRATRSTSGPPAAAAWLSAHGAAYGLCQIYGNEPWHYELRPEAVDHGCPPTYADPTHDPRMQQ